MMKILQMMIRNSTNRITVVPIQFLVITRYRVRPGICSRVLLTLHVPVCINFPPNVSPSSTRITPHCPRNSTVAINFLGSDSRKSHKRRNGAVPQFMAGVGGVELFTEQPKAHQLQRQVHVMCGWKK